MAMKISAATLARMKQQNLVSAENMAFYLSVGRPGYAFDYFAVWCKNNQWFRQLETGISDGWNLEVLEVTSTMVATWNKGKQ